VIVDAGFLAEQPHEFQSLTGMTRSENRLVRANSTGRIGPLMQACVKRAAGNSVLLLPPAWETGLQTTANVKVSALFSEGAPALVCYAHGKGKVWFLNAACGAESPLVDWGGPSMIEYILKESGCNPSMTVKGAYEDLKKVDIVCRSTAGGELIGAVCLPGDEVDFAPIRKPIEIILRERSHGYDSLRGRYLGLVDHFSLDLTSRPVALMTVVPWKLIQLKATGALRGDQLRLAVDWKTEGKKPETFYLSLQYKHNDDWVTMKRWISNGSHFETSLSGVDAGQEFRVIDGVAGIKAPVIIAGE